MKVKRGCLTEYLNLCTVKELTTNLFRLNSRLKKERKLNKGDKTAADGETSSIASSSHGIFLPRQQMLQKVVKAITF